MKILVTGVAGFIGMHVANRLAERGDKVFGIDNLNDYYDVNLKLSRLEKLKTQSKFAFEKCDVCNREELGNIFRNEMFDSVVPWQHKQGSLFVTNPQPYMSANMVGF